MPLFLITLLALVLSIVILIKKGRHKLLYGNLILMGFYELIFVLMATQGWDALTYLFAGMCFAIVHIFIMLIIAWAVPSVRPKPAHSGGAASQPSAKNPTALNSHALPTPNGDEDGDFAENPEYAAKQRELLRKLDDQSGGELPFDS